MTDKRRILMGQAREEARSALRMFKQVFEEESTAFSHLSEGAQANAKGQQMESNIETLEEIIGVIEDYIEISYQVR